MQDWQDPNRTYWERLLAWVNDQRWGTGTTLTILGTAISFLVKGELSPGAIAVAILVLTIAVPPAAPNAGEVAGVAAMIGALGLLVWLGLSLSPRFVLAVFVGVCLFLLILHLQAVHAETGRWQLDGPSVGLLTLCGVVIAILAITSRDRPSAPSHAAPGPAPSSAPTATTEPSSATECLRALGSSSPRDGREVEPDNNRRSTATPLRESFATLRGDTGAQNDRDWAAFCVDREASVTVRVVNPGSPDIDCHGIEAQLKGPRGGLLGDTLDVDAQAASTISRTLKPSDEPYSVLITESSGSDCRWLLDIEPRGVLAGETPVDSMPCLPRGEGLADGDQDSSTIDRAELLAAPSLRSERSHPPAELARSGTFVSPDEARWYVMCTVAARTLDVRLDSPDYTEFSSCYLYLQLLDARGQRLAEADEVGKRLQAVYNVSAGRRYYVKLGQQGEDAHCRWSLRVGPAVTLADALPTRR